VSYVLYRLFTTYAVNMILFLVEPVRAPAYSSLIPVPEGLTGDVENSDRGSGVFCGGDVVHHVQPPAAKHPPNST
jgi:hypothetical protein